MHHRPSRRNHEPLKSYPYPSVNTPSTITTSPQKRQEEEDLTGSIRSTSSETRTTLDCNSENDHLDYSSPPRTTYYSNNHSYSSPSKLVIHVNHASPSPPSPCLTEYSPIPNKEEEEEIKLENYTSFQELGITSRNNLFSVDLEWMWRWVTALVPSIPTFSTPTTTTLEEEKASNSPWVWMKNPEENVQEEKQQPPPPLDLDLTPKTRQNIFPVPSFRKSTVPTPTTTTIAHDEEDELILIPPSPIRSIQLTTDGSYVSFRDLIYNGEEEEVTSSRESGSWLRKFTSCPSWNDCKEYSY